MSQESWVDSEKKGAFPAIWISLHAIADAFPEHPTQEDKNHAVQLFHHLAHLLPCNTCNQHLQQELQQFPVRCDTGHEFSLYVWELHNRVNARLGKPILTWEQAQELQHKARRLKWSALLNQGLPNARMATVPFPDPPNTKECWQFAAAFLTVAAIGVGIWWKTRNCKSEKTKCTQWTGELSQIPK